MGRRAWKALAVLLLAGGAFAWGGATIKYHLFPYELARSAYRTVRPKPEKASKVRFRELDDGPGVLGRYGWDPQQLSIGLVSHGGLRISGKPKTSRARVARTARRGDTSILLEEAPSAWAVGDRIVLTGTHYTGRDLVTGGTLGTEDEVRTITGVRDAEIDLDRPLDFDHDTPREDLRAWAANLTRNIVLRSGEDHPLGDWDPDEVSRHWSSLGHVMSMHDEDMVVRYAAFDDLGRSNKNDTLDDIPKLYDGLNADRVHKDGKPLAPADRITNRRGRYAVHVHRAGATPMDGKALIEGSVVTGGPGWGFVCHDSRADFRDNVAYGVLGAAFVAETGNETGTWERNIAINTYGADYNSLLLEPKGVYRYENDDYDETILLEKRGSWKNQDFGHFGNGFWFQGKLIDVKDNVSVSSGMMGYFYMFRAPDQIDVLPGTVEEPRTIHSPGGVHPFAPGLNVFTGNESIADRGGLSMIGISSGRTNNERSVIADFTAWEVGQVGTHSQYYPGYLIKDSTFLASSDPRAHPTQGVNFLKVMTDIVLANLTIEGFPIEYDMRKGWSPGTRNLIGYLDPYEVIARARAAGEPDPLPLGYAHVLIDAGFTSEEASDPRFMGSTHREEDLILTSDQLHPGRFEIELDDDSLRVSLDSPERHRGTLPPDPIRPLLSQDCVLLLRGTKTDSIGSIPIAYHNNVLVWHADAVQHRLETQGYYRAPSGSTAVVLEEVLADRYTAERKVVSFLAELDPRWDLTGAIDLGDFDPDAHPDVYVPRFLLSN